MSVRLPIVICVANPADPRPSSYWRRLEKRCGASCDIFPIWTRDRRGFRKRVDTEPLELRKSDGLT